MFTLMQINERFPLNENDGTRMLVTANTQWMEAAHGGCLELCEQNNDLTFLSISEGKCFRNCLSKLNFLTPTFQISYINSGYHMKYNEYKAEREEMGYPIVLSKDFNLPKES